MAPWAVSDTLAYGFVAFDSGSCGQCFQLEFSGTTSSNYDDPGSAAIANKVMIVQVLNTGVGASHFDLLVPGGGVGAFDACSSQWNAQGGLGDTYGGFFTQCRSQNPGDHAAAQQCARDRCQQVFGNGMQDLLDGCLWWVDWASIADNPNVQYGQVDCPAAISGVSGM
jgi:hypothetical protein